LSHGLLKALRERLLGNQGERPQGEDLDPTPTSARLLPSGDDEISLVGSRVGPYPQLPPA